MQIVFATRNGCRSGVQCAHNVTLFCKFLVRLVSVSSCLALFLFCFFLSGKSAFCGSHRFILSVCFLSGNFVARRLKKVFVVTRVFWVAPWQPFASDAELALVWRQKML